jgi:hypothetical protein
MLISVVVITVIVAVVAVVATARFRKKRLQKRVRLEIVNQGNVRSRYQLRAEAPEGALMFRFMLGGDSLPEVGVAAAAAEVAQPSAPVASEQRPSTKASAKGGGARKKADQALTAGGAIAELLITLGTVLPSSVGAPLFQKASQLRQGQIKARRVEQMPGQVAWLKPSATPKAQDAVPPPAQGALPQQTQEPIPPIPAVAAERAVQADGHTWVQTPFVQPGETLAIGLFMKVATSDKSQHRLFNVLSCSVEQESAPVAVEEGSVQIGGGFWTRRFLPYLIIAATAIAILLLAFWLANTGGLA